MCVTERHIQLVHIASMSSIVYVFVSRTKQSHGSLTQRCYDDPANVCPVNDIKAEDVLQVIN